jgi:5-dehydro-2-deoxygluconokinase
VIKCLVQYHPDDTLKNRLEQEAQLLALYQAAQVSGHELLLEVIPPKKMQQWPDTVYRALQRLYDLGIAPEWWKLEQVSAPMWQQIDALIHARDPYCRGVVLLGLNAPAESLREGFRAARASKTCRGFTVGRTIFYEPSRKWFLGELDDEGVKREVAANFVELIQAWREESGRAA